MRTAQINDLCEYSGDFISVLTPKGETIQTALRNLKDPHISQHEIDWIDDYIEGEKESNEVLINPKTGKLNPVQYKIYHVPLHTKRLSRKTTLVGFDTYLSQAIESKGNVGTATNDTWLVHMILSLYKQIGERDDWKYKPVNPVNAHANSEQSDKIEMKAMRRLSQKEIDDISSYYVIALQQFVVRGIKHNEKGSKAFECLFLKNITKPENTDNVFALLTNELKMSNKLATKFIFIVNWATETGYLQASSTFLRKFNKGRIPNEDEQNLLHFLDKDIQSLTYFGQLLKPLYDIQKYAENKLHQNKLKLQEQVKEVVLEAVSNIDTSSSYSLI